MDLFKPFTPSVLQPIRLCLDKSEELFLPVALELIRKVSRSCIYNWCRLGWRKAKPGNDTPASAIEPGSDRFPWRYSCGSIKCPQWRVNGGNDRRAYPIRLASHTIRWDPMMGFPYWDWTFGTAMLQRRVGGLDNPSSAFNTNGEKLTSWQRRNVQPYVPSQRQLIPRLFLLTSYELVSSVAWPEDSEIARKTPLDKHAVLRVPFSSSPFF